MASSSSVRAGIIKALSITRFTASCEADVQHACAAILANVAPGAFQPEVRLSPRDRIDFLSLFHGIGIEVKWGTSGGSTNRVYAQLARYAEHEGIRELIFATPSRRVLSQLPDQIGGVPIFPVVLTVGL